VKEAVANVHKTIKITNTTAVGPLLDAVEAGEELLLDRGGVVFRLSREEGITYEPDPELVRKTLRATAGSWADLDLDRVIANLYAAREAGSRPPEQS